MMKVLGLLGGMSWESTIPYYAPSTRGKARLGGLHSAKIVLYSVDFQEVELLAAPAIGAAPPAGCWPPPQWLCAPAPKLS